MAFPPRIFTAALFGFAFYFLFHSQGACPLFGKAGRGNSHNKTHEEFRAISRNFAQICLISQKSAPTAPTMKKGIPLAFLRLRSYACVLTLAFLRLRSYACVLTVPFCSAYAKAATNQFSFFRKFASGFDISVTGLSPSRSELTRSKISWSRPSSFRSVFGIASS